METILLAFILIGSAGCFGFGGSLSGNIGLNLNGLIDGTPNRNNIIPGNAILPTLSNPAVGGINGVADLGINLVGGLGNLGGNLAPLRGILPNLVDLTGTSIIPNPVNNANNPVNLDLRLNGGLNCDLFGKIRKAIDVGGNLLAELGGRVPTIANISGVDRNLGGTVAADVGGNIGGIGLGARLFGSVNLFG